jgi:hypothetical protein
MTYFHGTNTEFTSFDFDMLGAATGGDGTQHGFFFAECYSHAHIGLIVPLTNKAAI